jgi:hypothetical protein
MPYWRLQNHSFLKVFSYQLLQVNQATSVFPQFRNPQTLQTYEDVDGPPT